MKDFIKGGADIFEQAKCINTCQRVVDTKQSKGVLENESATTKRK